MEKRIAILIPTMKEGGAERVASNLIVNFPKKWDKYLILFEDSEIDYPIEGEVINLGTKAKKDDYFHKKILNVIKRIIKLRKLKKKLNIDATISILDGANLVNVFSKTQDKIILSVHSYKSKRIKTFYDKMHKLVIKYFYNKSDSIVAVSEMVKYDLIEKFGLKREKIKVIYNGFNIESIKKSSKEELSSSEKEMFDTTTISTMGRLIEPKGQWHLIRSFSKVKKKFPDSKLIIIGKGELENYLKNLADKLNLEKDVKFLGFKNNPFKYINKTDLFVFPSLVEGFGNVLIESMASNVPIISTDCKAGPREILAPDTDSKHSTSKVEYGEYGVLIPTMDENKYNEDEPLTREENLLSNSIIEMLENEEKRKKYILKGKRRVEDFTIEKSILKWIELIEKEV